MVWHEGICLVPVQLLLKRHFNVRKTVHKSLEDNFEFKLNAVFGL